MTSGVADAETKCEREEAASERENKLKQQWRFSILLFLFLLPPTFLFLIYLSSGSISFHFYLSHTHWLNWFLSTEYLFLICSLTPRTQPKNLPCRKRIGMYKKFNVCSTSISKPTSENGLSRRDLLLFGLTSSVALSFPSLGQFSYCGLLFFLLLCLC